MRLTSLPCIVGRLVIIQRRKTQLSGLYQMVLWGSSRRLRTAAGPTWRGWCSAAWWWRMVVCISAGEGSCTFMLRVRLFIYYYVISDVSIMMKCIQHWSELSACDQRSNLGRPLFLVLIFFLSFFSQPIPKIPEGVVIWFRNFAKI
jgi:hypothetical protein